MQKLDVTEAKIDDILSTRQAEIDLAETTIAECEAHNAELKKESAAATDAGNLDQYRKAQQTIRENNDTINFYKGRLRYLESRKDVDKAVIQQLEFDLAACRSSANADFDAEVGPIWDKVREIVYKYRDLHSRITRGAQNVHYHIAGEVAADAPQFSWLFGQMDGAVKRYDHATKYKPQI